MLLNWSQALTPRNVWSISHGIFAISMFGTFWVQSAVGTIILFSIVGFSWAITCRIPYHLLHDELCRSPTYENGRSEDFEDSQGLIHGIHNFSICLAQIFVLLIINIVWTFTSTEDGDWFLVWFLRLGGVCALLAMYLTSRLRDLQHVEYEEISMEEVSSETLD
jgi:magnesium-transporting ATPase (P-type)